MKNLKQYILESIINEGGASVEGAGPIRGDLAITVSNEIISVVKSKFNVEMAALGSVGKKNKNQTCGDIDIAIEYDWDKYEDILNFVKEKFNCVIGNVNKQLHVFNFGYSYDEDGKQKIVQVDFMFTDNVDFATFAYNSPDFNKNESKYKGMYQSGLLMAIISNTPVEEVLGVEYAPEYFTKDDYDGSYAGQLKSFWKLYFDQNKGLKVEHKTYAGKTKPVKNPSTIKEDSKVITKNISEILHMCLGDNATRETCISFESELAFITSSDYKFYSKERLENIKNDFINDWQLKMKTTPELMKELETIIDNEINNKK
jgi:hypothetical protein